MSNRHTEPAPLHVAYTGFPSPAEDYLEQPLDVCSHLVPNLDSTFYMRAKGCGMAGAKIHDGDLLIVDRSQTAKPGDIVVAVRSGRLLVRQVIERDGESLLVRCPADGANEIERETFQTWGVVLHTVHSFRR